MDDMEEKNFSAGDRLACLFRKEFYSIIPVYLFILIPFASILAYVFGRFVDPWVQSRLPWWSAHIPSPWNIIFLGAVLAGCGLWLLWIYSYLILEGEGGPCPPFTDKTKRLVTSGPYKYVRHPSILPKFFGVIGLGLAFGSLSFLIVGIPVLLFISLHLNYRMQEDPLIAKFGDEYLAYKERTPALFPRFWK